MRKVAVFWGVLFLFLFAVTTVRADELPTPMPAPVYPVEAWAGVTSQGLPMSFNLVYTEMGPMVQDWNFSFRLVCDKTNAVVSVGFGFFGWLLPAAQFEFNQQGLQWMFSWSGSVYGATASGQTSGIIAALDSATLSVEPSGSTKTFYGAEKCGSGPVTWNAWPTVPVAKGMPQASQDHEVTVYKNLDGSLTIMD